MMSSDKEKIEWNEEPEHVWVSYVQRHTEESTVTIELKFTTRIEYNVAKNPVYVGDVAPGVKTNEIGWRIEKLTYDANNNVTQVEWADGSDEFIYIWDRRASYNYS